MAQPVFQQGLEEDLVQRVGTKLTLEVVVSAASDQEKVFFEWRGPAGSNAEDGRVVITEAGTTSRAEVTPLHLQVTCPDTMSPRARDFPNPHDGEMKSDPAEKLYETPTKKTMILMK